MATASETVQQRAAGSTARRVLFAFAIVVLAYAAVAGCYTLRNIDLGWQLANARYIWQSHSIARQEVFSYTAQGRPWVYPVGSELLFYAIYALSGYAGLVVLGMMTAALVTALALLANRQAIERPGLALFTLWLAVLAIPAIALRSSPRADAVGMVLFAACLVALVAFHRGNTRALYPLPPLFIAWANAHQTFIFGLLLFAPFAAALAFDALSRNAAARAVAAARLRRLAIAAGACGVAVLINPFGWQLYASLWRVRQDQAFQRGFIGEASAVPFGWWRLGEVLHFDNADSGIWALALLAAAGIVLGIVRRQVASLLLLAGGLALALAYSRGQGLFCVVALVVLPPLFALPAQTGKLHAAPGKRDERIRRITIAAAAAVLTVVIGFRCYSLATSEYYLARADISTFGFGVSWWFPERALDFVLRERLPANIYHDYSTGGWVMWRLYPAYKVYIDGRAQPYTPEVFLEQQSLIPLSPDSPEWQAFLDRRGVNTLVVSLARFGGYHLSSAALCGSSLYKLVYLDDVTGIWLRNTPANQPWIERLGRDCTPDRAMDHPPRLRTNAERYNFLTNMAEMNASLGQRYEEALRLYGQAMRLFNTDATLYVSVGNIFNVRGQLARARREYEIAAALDDSNPSAWHSLGLVDYRQNRFDQAAEEFRKAAERYVLPSESYRLLGETRLQQHRPEEALRAFEKARATSRYQGPSAELGRVFLAAVDDGEQRARKMMVAP